MKQITNRILMIQPVYFRKNEETAVNNYYQKDIRGLTAKQIHEKALGEFNKFVGKLENIGVNVLVVKDTKTPQTPDSIFPNNWISTHSDGSIFMYPMFAKNRRAERRKDIIQLLQDSFMVNNIFNDAVYYEKKNSFLEGTGSMVLDRENRIAYASISERTNKKLFQKWCKNMQFRPVIFYSSQLVGTTKEPIYHTNVMMSIAQDFAVVCLDSIDNQLEKENVIKYLTESGKEIIEINEYQKHKFAGNMVQLMGDKPYLVMSNTAFKSLNDSQIRRIQRYSSIMTSSLDTIEICGGGSARCMIAEIFLSKQ